MSTKLEKFLKEFSENKENIKRINLSEEYGLTEFPSEIAACKNLETLDISFTRITEIPDFIFQLPHLKKLSYIGCRELKSAPKGWQSENSIEVLEVYIPNNKLDIGNINSPKLKSITLSGNISDIDKSIDKFKSLEEITVFDTEISTLPPTIQNLKKLKKISFWQALFLDKKAVKLDLESIFQILNGCTNLKELSLEKNGIETIPSSICDIQSLQKLSFKDNLLTEIPESIQKLENLKTLDLSINRIKKMPKGFESLTNLKTLILNSNWRNKLDVSNLFDIIDKLNNLEILEIASCQSITNLPDNINSLKKLKELDVDNNELTSFPETIYEMTWLKKLRVSGNKLPAEQIEKLSLKLSSTKILA